MEEDFGKLVFDACEVKREEDNKFLEDLRLRISDGVYQDLLASIEMSENTYDYKFSEKPKGTFQIEEEFETLKGCYVNQSCGYSGDDYSGTISIEIGKNEYFEYSYWM